MPELPEVETTRRGIAKHLITQNIQKVVVRQNQLRWPIPRKIIRCLPGKAITSIDRRGKYLLLTLSNGTLIIHLGMSGSLRVLQTPYHNKKHDHVDILFESGLSLCYNDPRRFGAILWTEDNPEQHPLLASLGVEPLSTAFTGQYLYQHAQRRKVTIKQFLMNSKIVVGVGNIYANEALFLAGIKPQSPAGVINQDRYNILCKKIKAVLRKAITAGGTTLKDFYGSDGKPGYFKQQLNVYGREGMPCLQCKTQLKKLVIGQRTSVYCPHCQH